MLEQQLMTQAAEIAAAGHAGWGNTMQDAAAELAALRKDALLGRFVRLHMTECHGGWAIAQAFIPGAPSLEEVTDALIDLCVVAIGTMDALDINAHIAWDEVHRANMSKQVGIKASRPNPLGLPDLIKPKGWIAPFHTGNIGLLEKLK